MPEREILIKLLRQADEDVANKVITDYEEAIAANADYLLANGVIILPCKVGDVAYINDDYFGNLCKGKVFKLEIIDRNLKIWISANSTLIGANFYKSVEFDEIGKSVFFDAKTAMQALKE